MKIWTLMGKLPAYTGGINDTGPPVEGLGYTTAVVTGWGVESRSRGYRGMVQRIRGS